MFTQYNTAANGTQQQYPIVLKLAVSAAAIIQDNLAEDSLT